MPRAYSDIDRDRIRARLVAVGKKLVNRAGIRSLVVEDVTREAGISKGSFYAFFPSREEFLLTVFESWEDEFRGDLLARLTADDRPLGDRWESFWQGAFALMDREPGLAQLGSQDVQRLLDRLPPERIAAHQAEDRRVMDETFGLLVARGTLRPDDLPGLVGMMSAVFSMGLHRHEFAPGTWDPAVQLLSRSLALQLSRAPNQGGTHG